MVTDREDGLPRYLTERSDERRLGLAAMASCSIPLLNRPVALDGRFYYDGGVGDSIPVGRALSKGYGKVVAVLTRRAGVYPKVGSKAQAAYRVFFRNDPQFREALLSRPARYRAQVAYLNRLESQGRAFVIRPQVPELSHLEKNPELAASYYRHGYTWMAGRWPDLQAFLSREPE